MIKSIFHIWSHIWSHLCHICQSYHWAVWILQPEELMEHWLSTGGFATRVGMKFQQEKRCTLAQAAVPLRTGSTVENDALRLTMSLWCKYFSTWPRLSPLCCPESCLSSVHMATSKQSISCYLRKAATQPWTFTNNIVNLDSLISLRLLSTQLKLQIQIALWSVTFWFEWMNQRQIHVACACLAPPLHDWVKNQILAFLKFTIGANCNITEPTCTHSH